MRHPLSMRWCYEWTRWERNHREPLARADKTIRRPIHSLCYKHKRTLMFAYRSEAIVLQQHAACAQIITSGDMNQGIDDCSDWYAVWWTLAEMMKLLETTSFAIDKCISYQFNCKKNDKLHLMLVWYILEITGISTDKLWFLQVTRINRIISFPI